MIIPSIDLQGGAAVQLVGGKDLKIHAGDPLPIARRFALAGEIAVIDLDAAMGKGSNRALIEELIKIAPCRVGGGIRDVETAEHWLDKGASKVILGTRAVPEILERLPRDRVIAALDAVDGDVVVDGWRTKTGRSILERMRELDGLVGGYLVTFVEREGRMQGTDMGQVEALVRAAGRARVTIAGGVTTPAEIKALDQAGADAQVGMALYSGTLDLGDAIAAPLVSDRPDGLWPTVVCDEHGRALGLVYSSAESLREAVKTRRGVYFSRSRDALWVKGESSGAVQELIGVALDCDRDALRFMVRQAAPGFCHLDTWTCWGPDRGVAGLARRLRDRTGIAPEGSYTRRVLEDPKLLRAKLIEEARELATARGTDQVVWEAADVIYFTLVSMARAGVPLSDVEAELDRRSLKVVRRKGDAKPHLDRLDPMADDDDEEVL
ncbi:MAG: phosphoribosyl-ATP diphosphatase [Deltaproteobacteria bacterium]|nr:phosphoribosyl-ATP diphosphatase [Deltaproteobacteria bacterium]